MESKSSGGGIKRGAGQQHHDTNGKRHRIGLPFGSIRSNRVSLNPTHMSQVQAIFRVDTTLVTVVDIALSSLLGGGVLLVQQGKQLHDYKSEFYSRSWMDFTRKLLESLWMYGLAAVVIEPHEEFVGVPRVLDLSMLDITMSRSITGTVSYEFHVPSDMVPPGVKTRDVDSSQLANGVEILGVMVYEFNSPDCNGSLNSLFLHVVRQREELEPMLRAERMAVALSSNPVTYTQKVERKFVGPTMPSEPVIAGVLSAGARSIATADNVMLMEQVAARSSMLNAVGGSEMGGIQVVADRVGTMIMDRTRPMSAIISVEDIPRIDLPVNHQLAQQQGAREPTHLMPLMTNYEERVGSLFGVPRSTFAAVKGGMSGDDLMGRDMFRQSQRALKQRVIPMLQSVHSHIYSKSSMWDAITSDGAVDFQAIRKAAEVTVVLPGVPPLQDLTDWYMQGVLVSEKYTGYLSKLYGMPMTDFVSQAPLGVQSALLDIELKEVAITTAKLTEEQLRKYPPGAPTPATSSSSSSSSTAKKPAAKKPTVTAKKPDASVGTPSAGAGKNGSSSTVPTKKSQPRSSTSSTHV